MNTLMKSSLTAAAAVSLAAAPSPAQGKNPVIGTWVLNVAKSTYNPGPGPTSGTRTYTMAGSMVKSVAEGVGADGKATKTEYTAAYDGKDYPTTGNANADMIALTRGDANTIDAVLEKAGKETSRTHRVISKDGKTMTLNSTGTDAKGAKTNNVVVYDKK